MAELLGDIVALISSLFGKELGKMIENYYRDDRPEEMLEASKQIISGLVGERNAKNYLRTIVRKHKVRGWEP